MDYALNVMTVLQFFFAIVIGLYFLSLLKSQQGSKVAVNRESQKEMAKLAAMREVSLTEPLVEKTRPASFADIVGQGDGLKALRAALCGANPQHVIIYGPPGVGKTAAARLVLEEAKRYVKSPFARSAKFIELDATISRFDERGIADPLIGTVHDPIYQGAGALGAAGIPQPKPGAVSKAHGGILFIDEIGELHPIQINKLLKVLEDRKVFFESSYYSSEDANIPQHIHDIFQNGLPADFRLVAATTRQPSEIPPAIRSRCVEIYFRQLLPPEIAAVARNAFAKINFAYEEAAVQVITRYAANGRDAVNIVQIAASVAVNESSDIVRAADVEWVVTFGQYAPRPDKKIADRPQVGVANGLAVYGSNVGAVMEVEVTAAPCRAGQGQLHITGIVDEEELGVAGRRMRRRSMAQSSVDNVITVLENMYHVKSKNYDIHINFPNCGPVDGPSAGLTMAAAVYSAIFGVPLDNTVAMTGELSIRGLIKAVGGVQAKVEAAKQAGASRVLIPGDNWQSSFEGAGISVIPIHDLSEALAEAVVGKAATDGGGRDMHNEELLTASGSTVTV